MAICLYKTGCPECGSSDGVQVFDKGDYEDAYCFACDTPFKTLEYLEGRVGKGGGRSSNTKQYRHSKEDILNIEDIQQLPTKGFRGIREDITKLFNVKVGLSEEDGNTITHHYYPDTKDGKVCGYEVREVEGKKFKSIGDRKGEIDLWGKELAKKNNAKKLFITEGRCDAMALYQAIIDNTPPKFRHLKPSVVSLTRGATSGLKDILNNREFVEGFKEVILVLDNDEAGRKATKEILKTFPLFKVAELPLKDANDMLLADRGKELYDACVWNSKVKRQGEVVTITDDLIEEAMAKPKMGLSTPWGSLDKLTYGIRPHTITIVGAAPKQGKSEFKNQLVHHLIINHNRKVGVYDLEVHPVKTLKQIASKEAKINFLRPDTEYEDSLLKDSLLKFKGKLFLYDRTGSRDWEDIKIAMEEQHLIDGVCEFFLDPLTALISRYSASEANDKLNEILTDLADLVNKYPISVFCFSHVNPKPKTAKPHEAGGKVLSSEFTGSRALEKWSSLGLGIERDRSESCPEEDRDVSRVVILYDRDYGNSGSVEMFYNKDTTEYLERYSEF